MWKNYYGILHTLLAEKSQANDAILHYQNCCGQNEKFSKWSSAIWKEQAVKTSHCRATKKLQLTMMKMQAFKTNNFRAVNSYSFNFNFLKP